MLVQYCVHPEVEIILFAIIAVKHLISHWTSFHTNIFVLGFKMWGVGGESSIKITQAAVREIKKGSMHAVVCCLESDCNCFEMKLSQ